MAVKYWRCFLSSLCSFFLFMSYGMMVTYPSPAFPEINDGNYGFKLSLDMMSWLASFNALFAIPGSVILVGVVNKWGRKFAVALIPLPMAIGWLLIICSRNVTTLAAGRMINGLTNGMLCSTAFVYLSELAPKQIRGLLFLMSFFFYNVGGCIVNFLAVFVHWQWLAVICLSTVALGSLSSLFMYETPRWLVINGHTDTAALVMRHVWDVHDSNVIRKKVEKIAQFKNDADCKVCTGLIQLVTTPLWKPFLITQLFTIFRMFTGVHYINSYAVAIFRVANAQLVSPNSFFNNAYYQSCVIYSGLLLSIVVSMLLIDRFNRRILLIITQCLIVISLAVLGMYFYFVSLHANFIMCYFFWLPLVCLFTFLLSFHFIFNIISALLANELFVTELRGLVCGLSHFTQYVCYFVIVKFFPTLHDVPNYGIFWIFAAVSFVGVLFVTIFMPETHGKSLEKIQQLWRTKVTQVSDDFYY